MNQFYMLLRPCCRDLEVESLITVNQTLSVFRKRTNFLNFVQSKVVFFTVVEFLIDEFINLVSIMICYT